MSTKFIMEGNEYKFDPDIDLINKLGKEIANELIKNQQYLVKSKVTFPNLKIFLDHLTKKINLPELDTNNYCDFHLLNQEFNNIINDFLSKEEISQIRNESILQKAKSNENNYQELVLEYIPPNLDFFLEFYNKEMSQIPCTTLYNIFQHKNRVLLNHERAYQFIKQILHECVQNKDDKKKSFCILFETLDASKINEESLKELISHKDEYFGFIPKVNVPFITSFNESILELRSQIDYKFDQAFNSFLNHQQELMYKMNHLIDEKMNIIHSEYNTISNKTIESNDNVKNLSNKVVLLEKKVDQITSKINEICQKVDKTGYEIKDIQASVDQATSKIDKTQEKVDQAISEINDTQKRIDQSTSKIDKMQEKVDQITSKINETCKKVDKTGNEIKDIQARVDQATNKIDKTQEKVDQAISEINDTQKRIDQSTSKIEKTQEKVDQVMSELINVCNKVDKSKSKIFETQEKIDQVNSKTNETYNKVDQTTSKINEASKKIDQSIMILTEIQCQFNNIVYISKEIEYIKSKNDEILYKNENILNNAIEIRKSVAHYERANPFKGIIHQITKECNRNCSKNLSISVSSSSYFRYFYPQNAIDLVNDKTCFWSNNIKNSWLKYDFKNKKVSPNFYSIRSIDFDKGEYHPRCWVIEGSNTDQPNEWTILDSRNNVTSLDESSAVQIFTIQKVGEYYRYLRIRQTGRNSKGTYDLTLSALEYFGSFL